ncbi:hypothetical protein AMD24_00552 [Candidatus Xiphinematobacter sp. Idaho Grape]|nr:hypothetical protein AMD24_00552 [Candidatus Xiphinematobacter sp. Idaho Grape]
MPDRDSTCKNSTCKSSIYLRVMQYSLNSTLAVKYIFPLITIAAVSLFSGCATTHHSLPARSLKEESLIPWNRPADWEEVSMPLEHPG